MKKQVHIALDFDGTLAFWDHDHSTLATKKPELIPMMVDTVKYWLGKGYQVSIFTARVASGDRGSGWIKNQKYLITDALAKNGLPELEITAIKWPKFTHFVDDKAVSVKINTGRFGMPNTEGL